MDAEGLPALAVAAGLVLAPVPVAGMRARRVGFSLLYDAYGSPLWTNAFIAREIARRALECIGAPGRYDLVAGLVPYVRRAAAASRAGAARSTATEARPALCLPMRSARPRRASEQRLYPAPS